MSGLSRKRPCKPDPEERFILDYNKAYRLYLPNRKKMTPEVLTEILPLLEKKLRPDHGPIQLDSNLLFLKLCYKYRAILPEAYASFKDDGLLLQGFLALKCSEFFNDVTVLKKAYIEKTYRELNHMGPVSAYAIVRSLRGDKPLKKAKIQKEKKEIEDKCEIPIPKGL